MGLNPAIYWMDVSDKASYYTEKKEIKVAKWGTPKKYLKTGKISIPSPKNVLIIYFVFYRN
jgi:hypothetical protein